jgi:hypothetical protein
MNTGQTMLTIVAMILLSTVILTVNTGILTTNTTMAENRIDILAVSLANSIIEDATSLSFDENTVGAAVATSTAFTSSSSLGIDGTTLGTDGTTENRNNPAGFDDFDDYDCYDYLHPKIDKIYVPGATSGRDTVYFKTFCIVSYVDGNNPDNVSTTQTYHKRLSLRVFCPGMTDTVRMSTVYSYWYFR